MDIMSTQSILTTLLTAAALLKKPLQNIATQSLTDAYGAVKTYLIKKFGEASEAAKALELATTKPESLIRKELLIEETATINLAGDGELARLVDQLAKLLPLPVEIVRQDVRVDGHGNSVQVAGRDIIHTAKHVLRNTITPDERHLTPEQCERIREMAGEVANRLAGADGRTNFAAVYRMLQRRYQVASYLLIPRGQFDHALAFLKRQRAIHRSRLHQRNPMAYQNDFYRSIFAGAGELGWERSTVYRYAGEKLHLKRPIASLKELGPLQLKTLAKFIQREVRTNRTRNQSGGASEKG